MHFMMSMLVIVQLALYFGEKQLKLPLPEVPKPLLWQYIWLTSLVPAFAGYISLNKSRVSLMRFYYNGTLVLGLGTVLITMVMDATDLLEYAQTKETKNLFHNFPIIVVWYAYLFVAIQIHAFSIYFSRILLRAWTTKKRA